LGPKYSVTSSDLPPGYRTRTTSAKNAVTEEERRVRGLDPVQKELFQVEPGAAEAKRLVDEGIEDPRELASKIAKSINSGKQIPITDIEGAMLMYDRMRLYNAEETLMVDLEKAISGGGNVASIRQRLAQVADALDTAGDWFGIDGRLFGAVLTIMGFLVVGVIGSIPIAFMIVLGGVMIGVFPMAIIYMLVFILAVIFVRGFFWSST
jgi:hypothetical protein